MNLSIMLNHFVSVLLIYYWI